MWIKFISPSDYVRDEPPLETVKVAQRRTMRGDRCAFEKRAGAVFDYEEVIKVAKPGEYLVHVIALGCDEMFGPNRNGDTFSIDTCRRFHPTFKKYARWYREHAHHDPERSYGVVKLSAFNERDGRIELIVALNATKEAAQRNKGLIADKEIELLESGKDVAVSMACKVAYDVCSGCGNRARNRSEYCTASMCKYGGLRENIGRAFEDGHVLRAFNPEPKFFDISYVYRPADRIAYSIGVIKSGSAPWLYPLPTAAEVRKQLETLGTLAYLERTHYGTIKSASVWSPGVFRVKEAADLVRYMEVPEAVYLLTKAAVVLPVEDFLIGFGNLTEKEACAVGQQVRPKLAGVFNRLLKQDDVTDLLRHNFFYPRPPDIVTSQAERVLEKLASYRSILDPRVEYSSSKFTKSATYNFSNPIPDSKLTELADTYGLYQLASLSEWSLMRDLAARNVITMNRTL